MARTTYISKCRSVAYAEPIIQNMLLKEGYQLMFENNESVWKCGNGIVTAMKYLKFDFVDSTTVHISGWVKSTIGPEQSLDGYIGGFPKKQVRNLIQSIQAAII